jgi:hypothetical protein
MQGEGRMDTLTIVIVLALIATIITMLLGVFTMGAGGETDAYAGIRLMWMRVGLQALAIALMVVALFIH